jgi:hypothetical protein
LVTDQLRHFNRRSGRHRRRRAYNREDGERQTEGTHILFTRVRELFHARSVPQSKVKIVLTERDAEDFRVSFYMVWLNGLKTGIWFRIYQVCCRFADLWLN